MQVPWLSEHRALVDAAPSRQGNGTPATLTSLRCRALSTRCDEPEKASRPWDKRRDGFVMGEGAGVLVFESLDHARKRGAHIIAEYLGGAFTCDAHHMTDPRPDGLGVSTCIELALQNSGVDKDRVCCPLTPCKPLPCRGCTQ